MKITYDYQIANMDVGSVNDFNNVVMAVHYRIVAKGEGVDTQPVHSGVVQMTAPTIDFTPFNALTKEQVEQWVKLKIDFEKIEADLAMQLEQLVAVQDLPIPTSSKLPAWG